MLRRLRERIEKTDWWVVSALLFLLSAGAITMIALFQGVENAVLFRNSVAWLNSAAIACALFSLRGSLLNLRGEQMRRAYDPEARRLP